VATFALVHGAFCSGGTWDEVTMRLRSRGHRVVAPDLPCEDKSAGPIRYAQVVTDALRGVDAQDVVVVGHSLGGLTIPLVAANRPVQRMVFLAAFIPIPGKAFRDQFSEPGMFPPSDESTFPVSGDDGLMSWPPERAIPALMPDLEREAAMRAARSLRRQAGTPHGEVCPLEGWPDVPSSYILCRQDTQVGADWARRAARERLGTEAIEINGGHMPMIGRPDELTQILGSLI
jgi:pimeloyl-ACP methyl ester carboxylesterase